MISNNVKSAFEIKKLHSIPRIRELATHGSHIIQEKRKRKDLDPERRSKESPKKGLWWQKGGEREYMANN